MHLTNTKPDHLTISVIVPTYNEALNIDTLLDQLEKELSQYDHQIIVVDDSSPDDTSKIVERRSACNSRITLLKRRSKLGLASAVLDGFHISHGDLIVMMDADLSHQPNQLPNLIAAASNADIVIGSRYVHGGSVVNWPYHRKLASKVASSFARFILGVRINDPASGFAVFKRNILASFSDVSAPAGFKLTLAVISCNPGAKIVEVPITFPNRRYGKSKFTPTEIFRFLYLCWKLKTTRTQ